MNAKQRKTYRHRERMRERKVAKRILKSPHAGILDKMLARLILDPEANKPRPDLNWWEPRAAA